MSELMKKSTQNIVLIIAFAVLVGSYAFSSHGNQSNLTHDYVVVKRADIALEVNVSGKVKAAQDVDLAFERIGKISEINANVGDKVTVGTVLASIDNRDLKAQINGAQAQLASAKSQKDQYNAALEKENAKLEDLSRGARPEELQIAETSVFNAQKSLADQQTNFSNVKRTADVNLSNLYAKSKDVLNDAYLKADNSINAQIANLFFNASTANPQLTFTTTDSQSETDSEIQRVLAGNSLQALK